MKYYRIPLVWQMYGHIDVEAETLAEAIEYALGPECPLPEGNYVDESVQVDDLVFHQENSDESHCVSDELTEVVTHHNTDFDD